MAATVIRPETLEERIVYWAIAGTWGFYVAGALYFVAPLIGYGLLVVAIRRRLGLSKHSSERDKATLPLNVRVWNWSMSAMLAALIIAHVDFSLGTGQMLKSIMGWAKGWALFAVFAYLGATLRVRPSIIFRANSILALQTCIISPLLVLAAVAHLPQSLYVSPLSVLGGASSEFFKVALYQIDPETFTWRWRFFAPWSPAAALMANLGLALSLWERDRFWRYTGYAANLLVCAMTQSRMAILAMPVLLLSVYGFSNVTRQLVLLGATVMTTAILPFINWLQSMIVTSIDRFNGARASSSRVRATLQSIAWHRWNEAPLWGHGIVERGPHLVEYMPIGSHHTWNGLLFVKGVVGLAALAFPIAWSYIEMLAKAQSDRSARAALGVLTLLVFYSFGENLEILSYLFWPAIMLVGIASRRRFILPLHRFMSVTTCPLTNCGTRARLEQER